MQQQELGKILIVTVADQRLHLITRRRSRRHRHFVVTSGTQAQVDVFTQQLRREGDVKIQIRQRRRFIRGDHRTHHALVEEVEEGMPRHAGLFGQHRDLAEVLDHHAEHHVVTNLGDT